MPKPLRVSSRAQAANDRDCKYLRMHTKGRAFAMRALSLAEANKIITGTFASARKRKAYALAAIVLDAGGRVKAFQKQDGASLLRFEVAYGKAFAALSLNRSSRQVLQKEREKPYFMAALERLADGPLFLEGRGQL